MENSSLSWTLIVYPDDQVDACTNTPPGTAVDDEGRPLGDIDKDCDTDLEDHGLFQQGFTGPLEASVAVNTAPVVSNAGLVVLLLAAGGVAMARRRAAA